MRWAHLPLLLTMSSGLLAQNKIAFIEFFGYGGIDVRAIRHALPFRDGDALRPGIENDARSAVQRITGRSPTDVDIVCCVSGRGRAVFVGLPGATSHPFTFDPAPQGAANPPAKLTRLYGATDRAEHEAAHKYLFAEDDNRVGYRLLKDPASRAAEIALHEYTTTHEAEILGVLTSSGDARHRRMAAEALGFGAPTSRQIAALVRAVRDPDAEVRNNATGAIIEIVSADPSWASRIPPDNFIQMLRSGIWTDRNKASGALQLLTQSRNPVSLGRIQSEAGDALLEMASWRPFQWAMPARMIRTRIEGRSDAWAFFNALPLSLWQGAVLAAFVSGLLALAFVRYTSKRASWALGLLMPILISTSLCGFLMRLVGQSIPESGGEAFLFIVPWYLAAAAAACAIVIFRRAPAAAELS